MSKSVYLSPSTQEGNIGKGAYGTEEKRMNQICDVTQKVLEAHGVKTYRNKPTMTLKQLVADSNNNNPTIHFAIHSNAAGSAYAGKARGAEVYCHKFGGEGEKLARAVYGKVAPLTPTTDRGVKEGCNHFGVGKPLYELAYTTAPAALIEIAFHDNADDAAWIIQNIEVIGTAIAKGILQYFGIPYISPKQKYYRVQIGSFSVKANADALLRRVKAAGFTDAFIKYSE
ncbi:MAG: N-acetylmuramoyl-L-alanine amidase [Saccharofermentanales bacterium]